LESFNSQALGVFFFFANMSFTAAVLPFYFYFSQTKFGSSPSFHQLFTIKLRMT
jgi:hypothetical protein